MLEKDYTDLIERYSIEFQKSFHKFYEVYITNKKHDLNEKNYIFEDLELFKISNYYNQTKLYDNYIKESEYLGYIYRLIPINDKLEKNIKNSRFLFLCNIFKDKFRLKI